MKARGRRTGDAEAASAGAGTDGAALPPRVRSALLETLRARFEAHRDRHPGIHWAEVLARLEVAPASLRSLHEMERTGGEPDVVGREGSAGALLFRDCSAESPPGRRSLCYDGAALAARKEHRPAGSAVDLAEAMGVELLTEAEYRELQRLGPFDRKTSSWVRTPAAIRALGGALACDHRYGQVFTHPNGAQSYYAARGFRATLRV